MTSHINHFTDPSRVSAWSSSDRLGELLEVPRSMASKYIAKVGPSPKVVVELGAGPGDFLRKFLDEFPTARGIWCDQSESMLQLAESRLESYGHRITFLLGDARYPHLHGEISEADVVLTSRMTHLFSRVELRSFYSSLFRDVPDLMWFVNVDHVGGDKSWFDAMYETRREVVDLLNSAKALGHSSEMASHEEHFSMLESGGFRSVELLWKAFYSEAFVACTSEKIT